MGLLRDVDIIFLVHDRDALMVVCRHNRLASARHTARFHVAAGGSLSYDISLMVDPTEKTWWEYHSRCPYSPYCLLAKSGANFGGGQSKTWKCPKNMNARAPTAQSSTWQCQMTPCSSTRPCWLCFALSARAPRTCRLMCVIVSNPSPLGWNPVRDLLTSTRVVWSKGAVV
jgi:hypothetical protein